MVQQEEGRLREDRADQQVGAPEPVEEEQMVAYPARFVEVVVEHPERAGHWQEAEGSEQAGGLGQVGAPEPVGAPE